MGISITPQDLDQRFTAAATCLEQVLRAAITQVIAAEPLASVWQGCGGSTPSHTSAALKLQVRLELRTGCLAGLQLQDGRASDRTAALPALPTGALRVVALRYWSVDALQELNQQGSALATWTLLVTNLPSACLTLHEALVLGRVRWQIELLFKSLNFSRFVTP